jgi:CRP-like cAMP-binding protein
MTVESFVPQTGTGRLDGGFHPLSAFLVRTSLGSEEREALNAAAGPPRAIARGQCILEQGASPDALSILCRGVAQSARSLTDGRQQILALFVPGDALDCTPFFEPSRVRISALTAGTIVQIPTDTLKRLMEQHPAIMRALWGETAVHAAIQQEWMVSLGRQSAMARLAHLICELSLRFRAAGLADEENCAFPLTQSEAADALGISVVHMNRVLQQLRKKGLVALSRGNLSIIDREALYRAAEFDPEYLRSGANLA